MRLVSCPSCRVQYEVSQVRGTKFRCHCGADVPNVAHAAVDMEIQRCGACGAAISKDAAKCDYCHSAIVRDKARLSLLCPECYSANAEDCKFCNGCGVEFKPIEPPERAEELECPVCDGTMKVRSIGGIPIQECPKCNGLWVPENHFDSLVNKAIEAQKNRPTTGIASFQKGKAFTITGKVEYRKCPQCKGPMHRKNFGKRSGVIIDWCSEDGTWLDADELEQIASFIMQGGLQRQAAMMQSAHFETGPNKPRTKEQFEALFEAEKIMAEERARSADRQLQWERGRRHRTNDTLGDLLQDLLGF